MHAVSLQRLTKANPYLQRVMKQAAIGCPVDIEISEVLRTLARQTELVKAGASTMDSRHLTGHAVDFYVTVGGKVAWGWPLYVIAGTHIKKVAAELHIEIVWGGDFRIFKDRSHIELNRKFYP